MFRSSKSTLFLLLFNASLVIGSLVAVPATACGQATNVRSSAFAATKKLPELNYAPAAVTPVVPTSQELRTFELVNAERAKKGLRPYVWDAELTRMARLYSEKMAQQNFFSHKAPDGEGLREGGPVLSSFGFKESSWSCNTPRFGMLGRNNGIEWQIP